MSTQHAQQGPSIAKARRAAQLTLVLAGYRVALIDANGLRWFDPYEPGHCREGRYYIDSRTNTLQWCGDELPA